MEERIFPKDPAKGPHIFRKHFRRLRPQCFLRRFSLETTFPDGGVSTGVILPCPILHSLQAFLFDGRDLMKGRLKFFEVREGMGDAILCVDMVTLRANDSSHPCRKSIN